MAKTSKKKLTSDVLDTEEALRKVSILSVNGGLFRISSMSTTVRQGINKIKQAVFT